MFSIKAFLEVSLGGLRGRHSCRRRRCSGWRLRTWCRQSHALVPVCVMCMLGLCRNLGLSYLSNKAEESLIENFRYHKAWSTPPYIWSHLIIKLLEHLWELGDVDDALTHPQLLASTPHLSELLEGKKGPRLCGLGQHSFAVAANNQSISIWWSNYICCLDLTIF